MILPVTAEASRGIVTLSQICRVNGAGFLSSRQATDLHTSARWKSQQQRKHNRWPDLKAPATVRAVGHHPKLSCA